MKLFLLIVLLILTAGACTVKGVYKYYRRRTTSFKKKIWDGSFSDVYHLEGGWLGYHKLEFSSQCCATVYSKTNYQGREATFCGSSQPSTLKLNKWRKWPDIRSVKTFQKTSDLCTAKMIGDKNTARYAKNTDLVDDNDHYYKVVINRQNCCADFYNHADFGGKLGTKCYQDNGFLVNWQLKISSIKVYKSKCNCSKWQDSNGVCMDTCHGSCSLAINNAGCSICSCGSSAADELEEEDELSELLAELVEFSN